MKEKVAEVGSTADETVDRAVCMAVLEGPGTGAWVAEDMSEFRRWKQVNSVTTASRARSYKPYPGHRVSLS